MVLLRAVQERAFGEELRCLRVGSPVGRKSPIGPLCPFLDERGLLRCGGRLARAERLSFDSRFPVILPHGSREVQDFIRHLHTSLLHAGVDQVLGETRRWVWITRGRREVQKVVAGCVPCQRLFKRPVSQQMAALPAERVTVGAPFAATGVDCFGPVRVKIAGRAYHKVWVALFTCLATRAVHFEVLRGMSASAFLDSFVHFRARRPGVRKLFSDNGSNFVAADKEMRREVEAWNAATTEELHLQGVEWSFTPPASPHRGGVWERLVRSAKKHLAFLLHEENVHIETFSTVLAKAEYVINTRPLMRVGADPGGDFALTPMHFLCPGVFVGSCDEVFPPSAPDGEVLAHSWKQSRSLVDGFWRRCTVAYFHPP